MKLTAQSRLQNEAWPRQWYDRTRKPQGVALVATLIMLSLVTFMTVAFLGVARRERRSMESHLNESDARNAMYAGLAQAQSDFVARLLSGREGLQPDPWGYSLFVSTNFMNPNGFNISDPSISNVNDIQVYQFMFPGGAGIAETNWLQHLKNLHHLPRVPVFSGNYTNGYSDVLSSAPNQGATNVEARQGRFFLDFNRNGQFEPTFEVGHRDGVFSGRGHGEWLSNVAAFVGGSITGNYVGDPHWIGMAQDPTQPHGPSNLFMSRFAYLVMPAGKSLDLNAIHNQNKLNNTLRVPLNTDLDGYIRNHGVAGWELNLAAFIAGLNTNTNQVLASTVGPIVTNMSWDYGFYNPLNADPVFQLSGDQAHSRALSLLRHRFNTDFGNYRTMTDIYGPAGAVMLVGGAADFAGEYNPSLLDRRGFIDYYLNRGLNPWIGATNGVFPPGDRKFLTITELFESGHLYQQFRDDLVTHSLSRTNIGPLAAPALSTKEQVQTIDNRYTYYRLLSQMGTESTLPGNKVNLNFDNTTVDGGYGYPDETNKLVNGVYAPWTPLRFFTNVAQMLIDTSIETNVVYDDPYFPGTNGLGRFITNYYLGRGTAADGTLLSGSDTNRHTLIGGQSRFWNGSGWSAQSREIYYNQYTNSPLQRLTNFVNDHTLKLTNITVFPFNQYTPVLHRYLQVAANLHETAGNSREWVTNRTYGVGDMVRRYGRYYRSTAGGNTGQDPVGGALVWALDDPGLPHIFRPIFRYNTTFNSVYISEWVEVTDAAWTTNVTYLDVSDITNRLVLSNATVNPTLGDTPYDYTLKGFPFIVGVKGPTRNSGSANQEVVGAGIPNFNEVSFKTILTATRKLRFAKPSITNRTGPPSTRIVPNLLRPTRIDTMFEIGLQAGIGVEAWNPSQTLSYPRDLEIHVTNYMSVRIENGSAGPLYTNTVVYSDVQTVPANTWVPAAGALEWDPPATADSHFSFRTLLGEFNEVIPQSVYYPPAYSNYPNVGVNGSLVPVSTGTGTNNAPYLPTNIFPALNLSMVISNWFTYIAIDKTYDRVVDYVNLTNLTGEIDLIKLLTVQSNGVPSDPQIGPLARYYRTNLVTGSIITNLMPSGIRQQIYTSLDRNYRTNADWRLFAPGLRRNAIQDRITQFRRFCGLESPPVLSTVEMQAPFSPTMRVDQDMSFEVNDPLVHYMTYQLVHSSREGQNTNVQVLFGSSMTDTNYSLPGTIGKLNDNYRPWGGKPNKVTDKIEMGLVDPGRYHFDFWDFPERKFGSIGWVGRVHRGTPWQTIYMKSRVASPKEWRDWEGDPGTHPTNDWKLFDGLSAHVSQRAAGGLLGINQTNYAAWCAVLGGLNYLSNPAPFEVDQSYQDLVDDTIDPLSWQMRRIHNGIMMSRRERTSFTRLSEILSVPELSDGSPFISRVRLRYNNGSTYLPNSQVIHRGIRWTCVAGAGAGRDEMPPSFREHDVPFFNLNTLAARVNPGNISGEDYPFQKNDYVRYIHSATGTRLYRATTTTTNPPVNGVGILNAGWMLSPWREWQGSSTTAEGLGMSDNLVERIPQKIMGLLKRDPHPRVVIYAFGQALAPADQSRYLFPGPFQGLVTNYQVIGEVSSRTVLRVEGIPEPGLIPLNTNAAPVIFPEVVVEDHKILGRL